jgi:hypothetical protein
MRLVGRRRLALYVTLWAALGLAVWPVSAQTAPVIVRVSPASVQVAAGETVDIAVEAFEVQNLYAFDVTLAFDPQVVEAVDVDPGQPGIQVAQGLFLDPGFAVINAADNAAGSVHFVMTQLNPSEPKSGTGALIVVKLRGKKAGSSSALTVQNQVLARRDGSTVASSTATGQVEVVSGTAPPSTPMPTQGAGTPMALATPEPTTVQPTAAPATATSGPVPTAVPSATAIAAPSATPVTVASPVATATVAPSRTPLPAVSPTAASRPSLTAVVASATREPSATVAVQVPSPGAQPSPASAAPGGTGSAPGLLVAGLMVAGAAAVALWLRRRHSPLG